LAAARKAAADLPAEVALQVDLADALLAAGDPHEAARVLDAVAALPYEGASGIHGLYVRAHIGIGLEAMKKGAWEEAIRALELSKLYPEKLGTGAPFHPDSRMQDYLIALSLDRLGEKDKAGALREAIRDYTLTYWDEPQPTAISAASSSRSWGKGKTGSKPGSFSAGPSRRPTSWP